MTIWRWLEAGGAECEVGALSFDVSVARGTYDRIAEWDYGVLIVELVLYIRVLCALLPLPVCWSG